MMLRQSLFPPAVAGPPRFKCWVYANWYLLFQCLRCGLCNHNRQFDENRDKKRKGAEAPPRQRVWLACISNIACVSANSVCSV